MKVFKKGHIYSDKRFADEDGKENYILIINISDSNIDYVYVQMLQYTFTTHPETAQDAWEEVDWIE